MFACCQSTANVFKHQSVSALHSTDDSFNFSRERFLLILNEKKSHLDQKSNLGLQLYAPTLQQLSHPGEPQGQARMFSPVSFPKKSRLYQDSNPVLQFYTLALPDELLGQLRFCFLSYTILLVISLLAYFCDLSLFLI